LKSRGGVVDVSVTVSGFSRLFDNDLRRVLDAARAIDAAGATTLVLADHVVMGDRTDRYPFGTFPYGPDEPWPEPLTLLAAIAAVTERVRIGTGIVLTPLRPPALLAKTCATLDQISNGRLSLGVGPGWQREEYAACGLEWSARWHLLDDGLRACAALWTQAPPVSFESTTVSFGPTWCLPQPLQHAPITGIPLLYGMAATPAHVARIAELGAGWLPIHTTSVDDLRDGIEVLRRAFDAAGRDPATLYVRASARVQLTDDGRIDLAETSAANQHLAGLGVTEAAVGLGRHGANRAELERFVADAVAAFEPL
jgi:probable F420-dependent oxidoreductase